MGEASVSHIDSSAAKGSLPALPLYTSIDPHSIDSHPIDPPPLDPPPLDPPPLDPPLPEPAGGDPSDSTSPEAQPRDDDAMQPRSLGSPPPTARAADESQAIPSLAPSARGELSPMLLAAAVASSDDAIVCQDLRGNVIAWNRGAERVFGYRADEIIGRPMPVTMPGTKADSAKPEAPKPEAAKPEAAKSQPAESQPAKSQAAGPESAKPDDEQNIFQRVAAGQHVERYQAKRQRRDGSEIDVEITASPVFDANGRVVAVSSIARDVTSRRRAEDEAKHARCRAEDADRAKDRFLAVLSHELRTPLAPVVMTIDGLLLRNDLPEDVRQDLQMIKRNIDLGTRLIDDLLDVTRIAHGKLKLVRRCIAIHGLIDNVLEICRPDLNNKKIHLTRALSAGDAWASADAARLQQALWNVVKNAVKFTPAGGSVGVSTSNPRPDWLRVEVVDNGAGIDPELLPQLFQAFRQGQDHHRPLGGLGLGLAISKAVVELHGGTIRAESEGPGKGARFSIELPTCKPEESRGDAKPGESKPGASKPVESKRAESKPAAAKAAGRRAATAGPAIGGAVSAGAAIGGGAIGGAPIGAGGGAAPAGTPLRAEGERPVRVLLVEDHPDTLRTMNRLLVTMGYEVISAASAAEAVERSSAEPFDVVISDIGLPDASGNDLLRRLREIHPDTPGIALSGYGMDDDLKASADAGFAMHLTKPIDVRTLHEAIERLVPRAASEYEGNGGEIGQTKSDA